MASVVAADAARAARAKPPMPWNDPLTVRTAEIRTVARPGGASAADVLAELAAETPGRHFTADLDWLLRSG